jgi:hypothetical protein
MESRRVPALFALVGVVLAVALFLLLKDDTADDEATVPPTTTAASSATGADDEGGKPDRPPKPPKPEAPVVEIRDGQPVGGVQELEFANGEEALFEVETDAADELHLHGYDLYIDVEPGKPTEVIFEAGELGEGTFELESHSTGELLAEISVVPN